jgi:hypothetical protein
MLLCALVSGACCGSTPAPVFCLVFLFVCASRQLTLLKRTKPLDGDAAVPVTRPDIFGGAKPQDAAVYEAKKVRVGIADCC